jgi:competence ComEA-like helix-hairpin-helix protein
MRRSDLKVILIIIGVLLMWSVVKLISSSLSSEVIVKSAKTAVIIPSFAKIDLNTASFEDLEKLKGIGPVLAERIIAYRKTKGFRSIEELLEIEGIGPKLFQEVKNLVTVSH